MPCYVFECEKCGKKTEEKLCLDELDHAQKMCIECKVLMKRIISNTSFVLKGGGWAKDNYSSTDK